MTDLSRAIAVKTIIKYPREAQVGKSYLMTIDLQPEENFEWQYDEEEYPICCTVDSELFNSKPVGEPVLVLHRFGGTYDPIKFLLTANVEEAEGEIRVTLLNKWGVPIKSLNLLQIRIRSLNLRQGSMVDTSRSDRIATIIEQRKPLVIRLLTILEQLSTLYSVLQCLQEYHDRLVQRFPNLEVISSSLYEIQEDVRLEIEKIEKIRNRFSRTTLNIGIVGRARQGKSRFIQSLTGLSSTEVPDGNRLHCTGVRSTIYHSPNTETYADVFFHSESSFLGEVIAPYFYYLDLGSRPTTLKAFSDVPPPIQSSSTFSSAKSGAMYEYLHKYYENLPKYQNLLGTSSQRISKEQIHEFVAQHTFDGGSSLSNYLAVRDVEIFCSFPNQDIGQVALVDMPGLGDTGIGEEERLLKVLSQDVDVLLFVRMPKATGDFCPMWMLIYTILQVTQHQPHFLCGHL